MEVRAIVGPREAERFFVPVGSDRAYGQAMAFAMACDDRAQVVAFGVQPRCRKGGERRDILAAVALTVDLDAPDETARAAARERLEGFALPYSALVCSGHGLHAYWLLKAPLPVQGVDGPANAARYELVAQRLAARLGADHCWDLPRILRVPGTRNSKPGRPPVRSRVLELAPDVRYDLAQLEAALPPRPRPRLDVSRFSGLRLQRRLSPRMQRVIREGRSADPVRYPTRSEADFAVVCAMMRAGFSDDEIVAVFAAHPHGVGEKYAERGWIYLRCVIRGARRRAAA